MKYFLVLSRILLLRFRGSHLTLNGSRTAAGLRWPPSSERYCQGSNEGTAASQNHPTLRKDREEWGTRKIQDSIPKRLARESCDIADKAKKGVPPAIYLSPERRAFPAGTPNTSHDAMNGSAESVLRDWTDRFPDYGFHPFQERLELVEGRPRQITESRSNGAQCFQASRKDGEQRSSEIHAAFVQLACGRL
jgi:hypothetical protein